MTENKKKVILLSCIFSVSLVY